MSRERKCGMGRLLHLLLPLALALPLVPVRALADGDPPPDPTIELSMSCYPEVLTLPGLLQFEIVGHNLTDATRVYSGHINLHLNNGRTILLWRQEYDQTLPGGGYYYRHFSLNVPAYQAMRGLQRFKCGAFDITPPSMQQGIPAGYHVWSECLVSMEGGED